MLKNILNQTTDYIINNYNLFISNINLWWNLPEEIKKEFYEKEKEVHEIFQREYIDLDRKWSQVIINLEKIQFRSDKNPKLAARAYLIIQKYLSPILNEKWFSNDFKNLPLFSEIPQLVELLDEEGLLSSKIIKLGIRLSFQFKNYHFGFHESIPHQLQILLFRLAEEGHEVLFRPDPLNFSRGDSFYTKLQKAHYFGKLHDPILFSKRLNQLKGKSQFIRLSENPDILAFDNDVYKFEIIRTERDRIFYLAEALPYSPSNIPSGDIFTYILHSESDESSSNFVHIDSSILIYKNDTYKIRCENHIDKKIKANSHHKLFRINKSLSINSWTEILFAIYPRNELILEFLGQSY